MKKKTQLEKWRISPRHVRESERMSQLKQVLPFLGVGPAPSADDCYEFGRMAYRRADALVGLFGEGLEAVTSHSMYPRDNSPFMWVVESIQLQLEIARLTSIRLYEICAEAEKKAKVNLQESA